MKTGFYIEGGEQVEAMLKTLPAKMQKRVIRKAVRAAQKPLLKKARANAQAMSKAGVMGPLIAKHIQIRAPKRQRRGSYSLHVQMRPRVEALWRKTKRGREYYLPAVIEYGHGPTKEAMARPFMRPAAQRVQKEQWRLLAQELRTGLLREAIIGRYQ
jgi:hypothetical protein